MEYILAIIEWYTTHFADNLVDLADYAFIYGWLAGVSGIVTILGIFVMIGGYDRGLPAMAAVGQHLLVLGIPLFWGQLVDAFGSGGGDTASHTLPALVEHAASLQLASTVTQLVTAFA